MFPYTGFKTSYGLELQRALILIEEAVRDKAKDEFYYDCLKNMAPTEDEKILLDSIKCNVKKHCTLLRNILKDFTGRSEITGINSEEYHEPVQYLEGISKALFSEMKAVERFRKILECVPQGTRYRDTIFEVMTDEINHSTIFNFLYTKNKRGDILSSYGMRSKLEDMKNMAESLKYIPDDWLRYITPLTNSAMTEIPKSEGIESLLNKYILAGVFVGLGYTPAESLDVIEGWEKTGQSKILEDSKRKRK